MRPFVEGALSLSLVGSRGVKWVHLVKDGKRLKRRSHLSRWGKREPESSIRNTESLDRKSRISGLTVMALESMNLFPATSPDAIFSAS